MKALKISFLTMSLLISGAAVMQATAQINYNAIFGGANDDYAIAGLQGFFNRRDIKIASDGTIWICGSTQSDDGDLAAAGNHGGVDAWLLHINPATNQILYNRCFGGSNFDEFCSMLLMPDNTIWVCGNTNSSNGDLTGVAVKGGIDGWVMHIDPNQTTPAAQILYNRCIGGSGDDYFYYIAKNNNTIWLCGETISAYGDNTDNGFHGINSDAWLVGLDATQNASAALTYNRCFGGTKADAFYAMQTMPDGTVWASGATRSIDSDIAAAAISNHGVADINDGWLVYIDPSAAVGTQLKYNCCFGGTGTELFRNINVLTNNAIWLCGDATSTDGDLTTAGNHGNTDVWLICVDPTAALASQITYNHCFGGSAADAKFSSTRMQLAADGTIWVAAQSASTDGDLTTAGNHGKNDVWMLNIDPATNQFKYNKCFGGSADEIMPAIALDETKKQVWVVCGTLSNNDGDVPATQGGRDAWLFSINYGTTTTYTITATAGTGGSINPSGVITVNEGEDKTFTFSANNSNYAIVQVFIDDTNNPQAVAAGSYTFTNVQANHKIEVYFKTIVGIEQLTINNEQLTIYPNPTSGQLIIAAPLSPPKGGKQPTIEVFDVVGQVVFASQLSNLSPETTIDISHLSAGLYFLKVNGKMVKVIKE